MPGLNLYGENAFTFRFFDDLVARGEIRTLLRELKSMADPRKKFEVELLPVDAAPEVWLFPCLGKRAGFGEPDAVVMIDGCAFWFEVETSIALDETSNAGQDAFRQLARFHYAAVALGRGPTRQHGYLTYAGPTVSNSNERKDARLRLRGHQAHSLLRSIERAREHHHVLLTVDKPSGDGAWRDTLQRCTVEWFSQWDQIVGGDTPFCLNRAWYVYWHGDLSRFAAEHDSLDGYVPIKRA